MRLLLLLIITLWLQPTFGQITYEICKNQSDSIANPIYLITDTLAEPLLDGLSYDQYVELNLNLTGLEIPTESKTY